MCFSKTRAKYSKHLLRSQQTLDEYTTTLTANILILQLKAQAGGVRGENQHGIYCGGPTCMRPHIVTINITAVCSQKITEVDASDLFPGHGSTEAEEQNLKTDTLGLGLQLVWASLRSPERSTKQKQGSLL